MKTNLSNKNKKINKNEKNSEKINIFRKNFIFPEFFKYRKKYFEF